ncbi:hypothetical protein [Cognatiyoonia sp. IB215182]|nr:hypothetical protein [Cognatiyoonia sp. IB215182]MDX8350860.1 hypothetical protein [Cognatiyoonia sp. IB215182]
MSVIVEKIWEPQIRASILLIGKTCLVICGLIGAQVTSAFIVFSL